MKSLQVIAVTCALAGVSQAFAGTINFENVPSQYWETSSSFGGQTGGGQDLAGNLPGITFGSDAQVTTTSTVFPAHSGNFELTLADLINPVDISLSGIMSFTYSAPQPDVSFWYTSEFGFVAKAYDKNGNFLGFQDGNPNVNFNTLIGTDSFLDFGFGGIASVIITDDGGLGQGFTIDDLSIANVPDAASTLGLFGVAALGLLAFRRKVAA